MTLEMTLEYQKYTLPLRRRRQAAGRTVTNRPRRNRQHPKLSGLDSREYRRLYMQQWREAAESP